MNTRNAEFEEWISSQASRAEGFERAGPIDEQFKEMRSLVCLTFEDALVLSRAATEAHLTMLDLLSTPAGRDHKVIDRATEIKLRAITAVIQRSHDELTIEGQKLASLKRDNNFVGIYTRIRELLDKK